MSFLRFLALGLVSGWIVGRALRGRSFGWLGSTLLGGVGSLIGAYLFGFLGLSGTSTPTSFLRAIMGAVTLLFFLSFFMPAPKRVSEDGE